MPNKPVYLLALFCSSLAESQLLLKRARDEVTSLCGDDFELLGYGEHTCAIAFSTDVPAAQLKTRFEKIQGEEMHCFLVSVASVVGGTTSTKAWDWFAGHLAAGKTRGGQ